MDNLGNVVADSTIYIGFDSHGSAGERLGFDTALETADFRIYKDGSATQRSSEAGYTLSETFDSMVGVHQLAIDLSDNTDAGFYTAASSYKVVLYPDEQIDGNDVAKWIGSFRIVAEVPGMSAALNDLTAAQVNAEVLDVMNVDTHAEPGQGAPAATTSIFNKINFLYKAWRNQKKQDATTYELYNDAGTVVDQKAADSDDGTDATIGEIVTGP